MFESAEIGRSIDKDTYDAEAPALREALLEAQYELQQQGRFAVLILINGIEGAGKGETVKLLNEWMDARLIQVSTFDQQTDEELARPPARMALLATITAQGAYRHFLRQLVQPDVSGQGTWADQKRRARSVHRQHPRHGAHALRRRHTDFQVLVSPVQAAHEGAPQSAAGRPSA